MQKGLIQTPGLGLAPGRACKEDAITFRRFNF